MPEEVEDRVRDVLDLVTACGATGRVPPMGGEVRCLAPRGHYPHSSHIGELDGEPVFWGRGLS